MPLSLLVLIILPFLGSVMAMVLPANARNTESTLAGIITLFCAIYVAWLFPELKESNVLREDYYWLSFLDLNFIVRLDGFAWMFSMLILAIGFLVIIYARYYMSPADPVPRFFAFLMAFMGSMMGVVLSGNVIQMVFFWELTSLFSFLLIGYWHHRKDARRGARMALAVTGSGGLCLLIGIIILGYIVGSYDLDKILFSGDLIKTHDLYLPLLILVLIGAFTKSAQFPFQFWLPHAMAAPTPVSAYLHSATMVKLGIFLLARFWPILSGTNEWFWLVGSVGLITLLLGGFLALFQNDLKGLLAYSTISHLGLIVLLLGLNRSLAMVAAVFHIMNHATFKASLFMAVGIVDHETGTRNINRLSGLRKSMPITATLACVASAAMAGVPLLNGFLSKEMFFAEAVFLGKDHWSAEIMPILATVAGIFSIAYALRFTSDVFFGKASENLPKKPHEPVHFMRVPVELLVIICLVVGIFPAWSIGKFLEVSTLPLLGELPEFSLAVWHGINTPLIMSIIAMLGGVFLHLLMIFLRKKRFFIWINKILPSLKMLNGKRAFENIMARGSLFISNLKFLFTTQKLQWQILWLILTVLSVAVLPLWSTSLNFNFAELKIPNLTFVVLWVVGIACAIGATIKAKFHRMNAIVLLSGAGICTCLTFLWFSAPDLALTQLVVEVVTTLLILLGLRWLPKLHPDENMTITAKMVVFGRRSRDFLIACCVGFGMSTLTLLMLYRTYPTSTSTYFLEKALSEGGGSNVVNVMLVDFRGFDTFGEVVVLSIVALTVYALLRRFRPATEVMDLPDQQKFLATDLQTDLLNPRNAKDTAIGYLMIPAVLVRLILPFAILISAYIFLRGHNEPGGGFVAGLVFASALLLQYVISGTQWVEEHLPLYPRRWLGFGLLTIIATGLGSIIVGYPFLTSHTFHWNFPWLGEIHLASATFFDIGVFTLVVGATLLILTALAHQSVRSHRFNARLQKEKNKEKKENKENKENKKEKGEK